jgi:two-component system cell cycle sensor histidine kinase/response regulator CckA
MTANQFFTKLKSLNPWHFLWITVILSELFTLAANSVQSYLRWGRLSYELLMIGAVDSLFVPLVVAPVIILFLKKTDEIAAANTQLLEEVTERRRAETELEQEKALTVSALNTLKEIFFVFDRAGRFLRWNTPLKTVTGYSDEEISLMKPADFFTKDEAPNVMNAIETILRDGNSYVEAHILSKDGLIIPYRFTGSLIKGVDGKIIGICGIGADVTERRRAEETLRESKEKISQILNSVSEGIYGLDLMGNCTFCNPSCVGMLGYHDENDLIGKSMHELIHYRKADGSVYPKEECAVHKSIVSGEYIHRHKEILWRADATGFPAEYWAHPIFKEDELVGAVVTFINITERITLENQLHQAQKMEAIGLLAGGVAHDFNNILSAIIGFAHLTRMKMREDDPLRHYIGQILSSSDRAAMLTQSLLAFSRKQTINPSILNLSEVIRGFEKFLLRLIREDIALKIPLPEGALTVMADRGQIEQVIMNLVTNARDAMPRGGKLVIEARLVSIGREFIEAHGYGTPGEYVLVSVSDTGEGMDEQTKLKIFEPFFTTKEQGKGTGLGLAMVYGIVKKHNGFINVYSEPGVGTVFRVYLPSVRTATDEDQKKTEEQLPPKGGTETILIAEDDASLRELNAAVLNHFGYSVIVAVDGADAVTKFVEHKETIGLVVLDGIMPKMNGKEALREIKAIRSGIKYIFLSGYGKDILAGEGLPDHDAAFVLKPVSPSELAKKIREVLDSP